MASDSVWVAKRTLELQLAQRMIFTDNHRGSCTMISYSTLGTSDMQRSIRFYDPVFAALGGARTTTSDTWTGYGR